MANIIKSNATAVPTTLSGLVDRVFQDSLGRFLDDENWGFKGLQTRSHVPVNIRETDKTYEMEVVAPGLRKEDFNVQIGDNMLTVSFEQRTENKQENKDGRYVRSEYRMQSFSRSFGLDDSVDAERIGARYDNGILHITLPKKEEAQKITKSIEIK